MTSRSLRYSGFMLTRPATTPVPPQPEQNPAATAPANRRLIEDCDRCVKCGMCTTVCPTYRLSALETESPRGRITLIQALAQGNLSPSTPLSEHLENCLQCRACEAICPSGVPYGAIIEQGRALAGPGKVRSLETRTFWMLFNRLLRGRGRAVLPLLLKLFKFGALSRFTRASTHAAIRHQPSSNTGRSLKPLTLFAGCMGHKLQQDVIDAATVLLAHCGFQAKVSDPGLCCGALHAREGEVEQARQLHQATTDQLHPEVPTVGLVSACSARLEVEDFASFLSRHWPDRAPLRALDKTVAVHEACSLRNVLKQQDCLYALLRSIPGAQIVPLKDNQICCGAAGTHMLAQPQQAATLRQPKLDALKDMKADILITTNLGCALHFHAGLQKQNVEILHPAQLLARQLVP